ncbi:MAG TPA: FAD-dependent oxidoreductase [Gemmatimonadales bacterium]|nr:FAD-dependent oxidoreductase [Gemmatimonadales bacterium]
MGGGPYTLHPTPYTRIFISMPDYHYLIIGGGMTADAAARGIREVDTERDIGVLAEEPDAPYNRPPLSKGLWKGEALDSVWRKTADAGVALQLGKRVVKIDPAARRVTDHRGATYGYGRLLLATGVRPRRLVAGGEQVIYFRTLADYRRVRELADQHKRFAIIGGGFIGSELAAALATAGCKVSMIFSEPAIGARIFPLELARFVSDYYERKGVTLLPAQSVIGLVKRGRAFAVRTLSGADVDAHVVVAGLGAQPNVELAEAAGLPVENGIAVDERLRAGRPDVFAAGDVASWPSPALGRRVRVEHEDNALTMGRRAGRAMAGADDGPYTHLPFFYSDLFDLGYEAVGDLDARLQTVADWKEPNREGVVYYLDGGRVRGVLLWGMFGKVDAARELIADPGPWTEGKVIGAIK